jgi:hypothetical protein
MRSNEFFFFIFIFYLHIKWILYYFSFSLSPYGKWPSCLCVQECLIAVIRVFLFFCFRGPKWYPHIHNKAKIIRIRGVCICVAFFRLWRYDEYVWRHSILVDTLLLFAIRFLFYCILMLLLFLLSDCFRLPSSIDGLLLLFFFYG